MPVDDRDRMLVLVEEQLEHEAKAIAKANAKAARRR